MDVPAGVRPARRRDSRARPAGFMTMLAEYGKLSLKDVLEPAIQMADGYPIEAFDSELHRESKELIKEWPYSRAVLLPHLGDEEREAPYPGEIFVQRDLAATLAKADRGRRESSRRGQVAEGSDLRRLRSFLPGRHRRGVRARLAGAGRASYEGRPRALEGPHRGAGLDVVQGHRGLQADPLGAKPGAPPDAEPPRASRREVDGLQLEPLHPRALPGDEPCFRR